MSENFFDSLSEDVQQAILSFVTPASGEHDPAAIAHAAETYARIFSDSTHPSHDDICQLIEAERRAMVHKPDVAGVQAAVMEGRVASAMTTTGLPGHRA